VKKFILLLVTTFIFAQPGDDCTDLGDLNGDGTIDFVDTVSLVNIVINSTDYNPQADLNEDGLVNAVDIFHMVDWILNGSPTPPVINYNNQNLPPYETRLSIQSAMDSASQNNYNLFFVDDTIYIIDSTITIPSCIEIDFNNSTIQRDSNLDFVFDMIVNDNPNPDSCGEFGNANITLKNLIIDGTGNGFDPDTIWHRFSGLKLSGVEDSRLDNITVINTINGEHRSGIAEENPAAGIFFTGCCNNISCYNVNAYYNDVTGIIIYKSTNITIDSSVTINNGGSGIGSQDSDHCNFYNIVSSNNGYTTHQTEPHYSNISINGENCIIDGADSKNCTGSGLNIGHTNEESKADSTIVRNVNSYHNELDGITIKNSDYVEMENVDLHHNKRHNLLIKSGWVIYMNPSDTVWYDATHAKITNSEIYGYYDQINDSEGDSDFDNDNMGGYGVRIEEGSGHIIDGTSIYDNFFNGIGIVNVEASSDSIVVGPGVSIYNNGRADEFSSNVGGIPHHISAGIRIHESYDCRIKCPVIYCDDEDENYDAPDTTKSQDYGIFIIGGGNHEIKAIFPADSTNLEGEIYPDDYYWENCIETLQIDSSG